MVHVIQTIFDLVVVTKWNNFIKSTKRHNPPPFIEHIETNSKHLPKHISTKRLLASSFNFAIQTNIAQFSEDSFRMANCQQMNDCR